MAFAWLEWNSVVYWAELERAVFEPRSAVTVLVDGIWRHFPDSAHFILRSRIYTTQALTELCRGTVLVCAKRITRVGAVPEQILSRMSASEGAFSVTALVPMGHPHGIQTSLDTPVMIAGKHSRAAQNRSIEAWLLSAEGTLLATARNTAGRNRFRHAEINLLQDWWAREHKPLPSGGCLVVTLEPCAMCAGAIWECVADKTDFRVLFVTQDPGPAAAKSVLHGHVMLQHCKNIDHPE